MPWRAHRYAPIRFRPEASPRVVSTSGPAGDEVFRLSPGPVIFTGRSRRLPPRRAGRRKEPTGLRDRTSYPGRDPMPRPISRLAICAWLLVGTAGAVAIDQ